MEGDRAVAVVDDGRHHALAGCQQCRGIGGCQARGIVSHRRIDQLGDVVGPDAEKRLGEEPLWRVVTALQHAALNAPGNVRCRHRVAVVEGHALADREGVGHPIFRDRPVRGQLRNELDGAPSVVPHQRIVGVLEDLAAGRLVIPGRIKTIGLADGGYGQGRRVSRSEADRRRCRSDFDHDRGPGDDGHCRLGRSAAGR